MCRLRALISFVLVSTIRYTPVVASIQDQKLLKLSLDDPSSACVGQVIVSGCAKDDGTYQNTVVRKGLSTIGINIYSSLICFVLRKNFDSMRENAQKFRT